MYLIIVSCFSVETSDVLQNIGQIDENTSPIRHKQAMPEPKIWDTRDSDHVAFHMLNAVVSFTGFVGNALEWDI